MDIKVPDTFEKLAGCCRCRGALQHLPVVERIEDLRRDVPHFAESRFQRNGPPLAVGKKDAVQRRGGLCFQQRRLEGDFFFGPLSLRDIVQTPRQKLVA